MRKDEFLQLLKQSLAGDVPPRVVEEHIRYYDSYITEEVRKGASEEGVIAEIGDPRLIARTIEDTTDGAGQGEYREPRGSWNQSQSQDSQDEYTGSAYRQPRDSQEQGGFHVYNFDKWYMKIVGVLLVVAVVFIVFSVIGGIFTILSPLLMPICVIWLIMWIVRSFTRR